MMGNEIYVYLVSGAVNFCARVNPRSRYKMVRGEDVLNMVNLHIFGPFGQSANPRLYAKKNQQF